MHGDYSRGHEPDRKRGRNYRRVLLQMGRPVLDSDVASMVDAVLGEVRSTTRGLSCSAGSPDLGFLVTPGRLLAIFAEAQHGLAVKRGTPDAWIDYRHRFADRYPALYLSGGGAPAQVTVPVLQPMDPAGLGRAALWARVEAPTTIKVNGIDVQLTPESPDAMQRVEFATGGLPLDPLDIAIAAGDEVWLFLLEQDEMAGTEPAFWVAPGSYHVDGLVTDARGGGSFPAVAFPESAGFPWAASLPSPPLGGLVAPAGLAAGGRLVVYLETWERHITAVEDPGIHEVALGSADTCTRTQLLGQVKLATLTGVLPAGDAAADAIRAAFANVEVSGGRLNINVPESTPTTDPCALPDIAGYSGSDNRLYRVEVHRGGGLSQVRLKWSRDNGSELFAARLDGAGQNLVFDAGTALAAGDIVEVLSNVIDLGDDALAQVGATGFVPAQRAVGWLAQLAAVEIAASADEVVFRLVEPDNVLEGVSLDDRFGTLPDAVLKLRRWHGILDPQQIAGGGAASPGPHVLEDGLTVELSATGSYRPGQYWQHEARVLGDNANGPWRPFPHGPERRFAPLALLEFAAPAQPLRLLAWLDERFSHPCDLDADDVAFAGGRVDSTSDTVQEAIEELFERPPMIVDASCGEIIIRPENDWQTVFDTIPEFASARLCIHPGTWEVSKPVTVQSKGDLVISGAGAATILRGKGIDSVLRFVECGHVRMQDVTIVGGVAGTVGEGLAGSLAAVSCRGLDIERVTASCADSTSRRMSAVEVRSPGPGVGAPDVRVRGCHILAGNAQVGLLVVNAASVDVQSNVISAPPNEWPLRDALADPIVAGRVGRLLLDDFIIGETDEATDELLVGSPNVLVEASSAGDRRRFIVHLDSWGAEFITFSTTLSFGTGTWRQVFDRNPIPGNWGERQAPAGFLLSNLRSMRRLLVSDMFGFGRPVVTIPAAARTVLRTLAENLTRQNATTAGGQGIVIAGRGTGIDTRFPQPGVLTVDPRPDARITSNRILGFTQGIHVGTSGSSGNRGVAYRVSITDNLVQLNVPSLSAERHGIYVGSVFHLRIHGNSVELTAPPAPEWGTLVGPLDGIHVYGTFGPLIQVRENSCIGTRRGVVLHAVNAIVFWRRGSPFSTAGWRWAATDNAHFAAGPSVPETINW
ncbi:MAG TPA: DUF6519 domain-containing protein [Nakamurella sp.]